MKFEMSFIFEIIQCVHEVILSQCVLDAIRVNMDLTHVEQLGLTDEEWEPLFDFLVPTLSHIRE